MLPPYVKDMTGKRSGRLVADVRREAVRDGAITRDDVLREVAAGHVRPSLALIVGETPLSSDEQWAAEQRAAGRKEF